MPVSVCTKNLLWHYRCFKLGKICRDIYTLANAERSKEQELRCSGELIYKGHSAVSEHVLLRHILLSQETNC